MGKTRFRVAAFTLVLVLTFAVACAGLAAPGSSALGSLRDGLQPNCMKSSFTSGNMDCSQPDFVCPLAVTPGLSSVTRLASSPTNDFSMNGLPLLAKAYSLSVREEIFLTGPAALSPYQLYPQKVSTHLLHSVLTL